MFARLLKETQVASRIVILFLQITVVETALMTRLVRSVTHDDDQ